MSGASFDLDVTSDSLIRARTPSHQMTTYWMESERPTMAWRLDSALCCAE